MKKEGWLTIVRNQQIALDTFEMILKGDLVTSMTEPGQFLHIQVGNGMAHMLRRPISITDVDIDKQIVTIIYKAIGEGTKWLSERKPAEKIHVLGPRGNGFPIHEVYKENILLIGGGVGVPPLYYLAKRLIQQENSVTAVLGFQTKDAIFYEKEFSEICKTIIVTDDGSRGKKGFVTNVLPPLKDETDRYYSCGPTGMLAAVTKSMGSTTGYISLEERMGCGIGACFACVCKTADQQNSKGYVKICSDGPVFHSNEVLL